MDFEGSRLMGSCLRGLCESNMRQAACAVLAALLLGLATPVPADAGPSRAMRARNHIVAAPRTLLLRAEQGDPRAQYRLAYMYWVGRGLPKNDIFAAGWALRAAMQGEPRAQYMLGLLYDRGHGVPQNYVAAYMWLNLSSVRASPSGRNFIAKMRDALATKMTHDQLFEAQQRSLAWIPVHELPR